MNTNQKKQAERGVALIAVMLTLLLVTAMAAAIIILANSETRTSSNFNDAQRAFFAAKSGIEEARDRLRTGNSYTLTTAGGLPTGLPGASSSVLYIKNPLTNSDTVEPWNSSNKYVDDEICNQTLAPTSTLSCTTTSTGKKVPSGYTSCSGWCASIVADSTFKPTSGALDWKWARITLKANNTFGTGYYVNGNSSSTYASSQVKWNGNTECITGTACTLPVYIITSLAVTSSGARRMVQMEVAQDQLIFNAPAALTLDGTSDSFSGGSSNNYTIDGNNHAGCGVTSTSGTPVPAVGVSTGTKGTPNTGEVSTVINGIPNGRMGNYTGLGSTPDVENVSSSYTSAINSQYDLSTVTGLETMVSAVKTSVTQPVITGPQQYSGNAASLSSSSGNPQIVYVNGDLTLSGNANGYGILVVTGTLTVKGTVQWNGLVLVVGQGNLQMDGTNNFYGAVLVAKTKDSSGNKLTSIGSPTFGVNGGGNSNGGVFYSSTCIGQNSQLTTYHSVSFRELMN